MSDSIKRYEGKDADVCWDSRLCIHVGECGRSQDELFVGGRDPWCQPDMVSLDQVVRVVERCPTGAITYERKDGGEAEVARSRNTVMVANNGPLYVRGQLEIEGAAEDMDGVKFRAALCRCGQSRNKPFCDGAHDGAGFKDFGAVGRMGDAGEGAATGGLLKITKFKDGPLYLQGNFEIVSAGGCATFKGSKAALCRCGASKDKPFCDGSHKAAGFTAE